MPESEHDRSIQVVPLHVFGETIPIISENMHIFREYHSDGVTDRCEWPSYPPQ